PIAIDDAPAPLPPAPPAAPAPTIDWEQFFGVRGAAILGGIALALAGLLFFKYSIEQGLIPPWLRVVLGTLVGVGCIAGSEWSLRRNYAGTANALAGAGLALLYAAFWAASARYDLVPMAAGFILMIAVTATGCVLAARHQALVIAVLGLSGGFATPLLLSTGADRPIGLFGYLLLLDLGVLLLAQRRGWPMLAWLSLAGTAFYQIAWMGLRMDPERLWLGLVILGVFALAFAAASTRTDSRQSRLTGAAAVLFPFVLAFYFAVDADFGPSLSPVAALLVLLACAAGWLSLRQGPPTLALAAAAACVAVITVWAGQRTVSNPFAWELAVWSCLLALTFHAFVERHPQRAGLDGPAPAALVSAGGFFVLLIAACSEADSLAPWLVGFAGLAALLIRHGDFPERAYLHLAAGLAVALGLATLRESNQAAPWFPSLSTYLALMVAAAAVFQAVALLPRPPAARRMAEHAAALVPVALLLGLMSDADSGLPFLVATLLLGLLAALAATRLGLGLWLLAGLGATALCQHTWMLALPFNPLAPSPPVGRALALQVAAVLLFTAWPFLTAARFRYQRWAWAAAALAGPLWFLALRRLWELQFGPAAIGLLPLLLGGVSLAALARARRLWQPDEAQRTATLAWFAAIALGFITVAIPLQLDRQWITVGWALEGIAVLVLWTRLDHPGLKYLGVALLAAVFVRLVANPAVLDYYPRPTWRIVNWLLYTYLVPAAAMLAASTVLVRHELARLWPIERQWLYVRARPFGALLTGGAGLIVVFVWLNLAIADWFSTGDTLVVSFARLPARDLTTSIVWALYALLLLGVGMARRSTGLRWASLGLLLVTIAKVFLYDLGELRDLYRVASLLGLAVSLILVSLAYQRFVFRAAAAEKEA
ncbi:MAG: DUF2339 domain-containing protein, partial [Candidatus Binatia bacterium]